VIPWDEFTLLIDRGLNLFSFIRHIADEYAQSYDPPKTIRSRLTDQEPEMNFTIYCNQKTGAFGFTTGKYPPNE
jgi:hypothetical protein